MESGFPQPVVQPGQIWYYIRYPDGLLRHESPCLILNTGKLLPLDGGNQEFGKIKVFAPTATEIMRYMDNPSLGYKRAVRFLLNGGMEKVEIFEVPQMGIGPHKWLHNNPAEALAIDWIKGNRLYEASVSTITTDPA
jgi:hypothetical protein